ncbi:hypothetical protein KCU77_g19, partial [Aureobasidium melanogenum]
MAWVRLKEVRLLWAIPSPAIFCNSEFCHFLSQMSDGGQHYGTHTRISLFASRISRIRGTHKSRSKMTSSADSYQVDLRGASNKGSVSVGSRSMCSSFFSFCNTGQDLLGFPGSVELRNVLDGGEDGGEDAEEHHACEECPEEGVRAVGLQRHLWGRRPGRVPYCIPAQIHCTPICTTPNSAAPQALPEISRQQAMSCWLVGRTKMLARAAMDDTVPSRTHQGERPAEEMRMPSTKSEHPAIRRGEMFTVRVKSDETRRCVTMGQARCDAVSLTVTLRDASWTLSLA